ncbi:MAG: phycobilisome protein [Cyanobacteria bacterium P01_H01_bin.58]
MPLSAKVQELIQKSRIVSFSTWETLYPAEAIRYFQMADDERRYLSDTDCHQLAVLVPGITASLTIAQFLRDQVNDIVDEARMGVLENFPNIMQPGGGLYPAERAQACWRDFWHFLRCITYGIAGQRTDYTSADGLHHMQLLYQELQVPLDAMVLGLEGIKQASLTRTDAPTATLEPYFEHLIVQLQQFR